MRWMSRWSPLPLLLLAAVGCAWDTSEDAASRPALACAGAFCDDPRGDGGPLPRRRGTIVSDGCFPDARAFATLSAPGTRQIVEEIVLLCLIPRSDGAIAPTDTAARDELRRVVASVQNAGIRAGGAPYRVSLGVSFTDETGVRFDGAQTAAQFADSRIRGGWVEALTTLLSGPNSLGADAIDLNVEAVPPGVRSDLTVFTEEVAGKLHAAPKRVAVNLFVPPSLRSPSDLPSGDAFNAPALGRVADRLRVMTLDYSDRTTGPGPTIVPGWAVDAARFARTKTDAPLDVAVPLYGHDFGPSATRGLSYLEAAGLAGSASTVPKRGITDAISYVYSASDGPHTVWVDDARSLGRTLAAWQPAALEGDVGIVYFGLGGEDPSLFSTLAARTPR
jgi:hypothetical protein